MFPTKAQTAVTAVQKLFRAHSGWPPGAPFGRMAHRLLKRQGSHDKPGFPGKETEMLLDVLFMSITVGFFVLSLAYTSACGRL